MKTIIILVCLFFGCNSNNLEDETYFNGYMDGFTEAEKQAEYVNRTYFDFYAEGFTKNGYDTLICLYPAELIGILGNFRFLSLNDITNEQMNNKIIFNNYQNWLRRRK